MCGFGVCQNHLRHGSVATWLFVANCSTCCFMILCSMVCCMCFFGCTWCICRFFESIGTNYGRCASYNVGCVAGNACDVHGSLVFLVVGIREVLFLMVLMIWCFGFGLGCLPNVRLGQRRRSL